MENYNNGNKVPLIAKAFDILANMEETIDDLRNGKEDGQLRPLVERYQVFAYRVDQLTEIFGNTQPTAYLGDCLNNFSPYVSGLVVFFKRLFDEYKDLSDFLLNGNGLLLKYVIVDNQIILAPSQNFVHGIMTEDTEAVGGVIKVFQIGNHFYADFIRGASSVASDKDGKRFYQLLGKVKNEEIKCLKPSTNNPTAGLSNE